MSKEKVLAFFLLLLLVFLFAGNGFASHATPDTNIMLVGSRYASSPGDGNYFKPSTVRKISFSVQAHDVNGGPDIAGSLFDLNVKFYYSATEGALTTLIEDINLMNTTYCGNNNFSGTTRACNYDWTVPSGFTDGNFFIDFNLYAILRSNRDTRDANATESSASFVLDEVSPTATITSSNVSDSTRYTLTWTSTDATAGVDQNYYSSTADDNASYSRLGTATSQTITIGAGEQLPVTKTFYIKAQDRADINGSASINVTFRSPSGGGQPGPRCGDGTCNGNEIAATCPADCLAKCGDNACTHTESSETCPRDCAPQCGNRVCDAGETAQKCPRDCAPAGLEVRQVVKSKIIKEKPTKADISSVLKAIGASAAAIERASEAVGKVSAARNIVVEEVTVSGQTRFETTVSLLVTNTSGASLNNVTIIENIPKSVAANASLISSKYNFNVLVADPIVEFTIPAMYRGETAEIGYTIKERVKEEALSGWFTPFASKAEVFETKPACVTDADCNDGNVCTADRCTGGTCSYASLPNNTSCGVGLVCLNGACVDEKLAELPPRAAGLDPLSIMLVLIIVLVVAYYIYSKHFRE